MGLGPRQVVSAPPAAPPSVGLVAAARDWGRTPDPIDPDNRWMNGYAYSPENCVAADVADPCDPTFDFTPAANQGIVEAEPFLVWAPDECSAFDFRNRNYEARAIRVLEACESKQIARELWRGDLSIESGWNNSRLASLDSDVVGAAASAPKDALACLEQGLAECGCGAQGMIHATRQLVTHWQGENLLRREGNLILTYLDTVVVPDAGYDGSGPPVAPGDTQPVKEAASGSIWAYATGMVFVKRGPIEVVPVVNGETVDIRNALARGNNTVSVRAQRMATATWDSRCCHLAVEVDMTLCGLGGAGS